MIQRGVHRDNSGRTIALLTPVPVEGIGAEIAERPVNGTVPADGATVVQLHILALDENDQPLPDQSFNWSVNGDSVAGQLVNGQSTLDIVVDPDAAGLVEISALGYSLTMEAK